MYPPPSSGLDAATVAQLDDQFFTSDPFSYIRARILALLNDDRPSLSGDLAEEFKRLIGPSAAHYAQSDDRTAQLQVAVDAFALRHQVAESLLRLVHVVLHHQPGNSHWVELIDTPTKTIDVMRQNRKLLDEQDDRGMGLVQEALLGLETTEGGSRDSPLEGGSAEGLSLRKDSDSDLMDRALTVHVAWINYAIQLIRQESPDLNAAHNKFKHGMGLRPQDDVLTTFTLRPPNSDGSLPLSALTGEEAVNLLGGPSMEFLARASRRSGLEATQIAMMPGPTLAEAAAMAHTLALFFHNAAVRHFADHEPHEGRSIPCHPGVLVDGPRPDKMRTTRPFALRFPLTTPLREGPEAELFWTNGEVNTLVFGERMHGVVVDDEV